jgi:hypothetical protein
MINILMGLAALVMISWGTKLLVESWRLKQRLGMFLIGTAIGAMLTVLYVAILNFVQ